MTDTHAGAIARPESDARLFDIMYSCRAMRRLKPDAVPESVLLQLVDAALQGPSGSNSQNWHFIIVRDGEQKARIAAVWKRTWDFYLETLTRAEARPGEDMAVRKRSQAAASYLVEHMVETPAIVFVAIKRDEALGKIMRAPSTMVAAVRHFGVGGAGRLLLNGSRTNALVEGATAYPAVQNLLLAARALGLGTVLTTPHFFVPGAFETILGVPSDVAIAAALPIGYPKGNFGPTRRPAPEQVVSWDRYGGAAS